MQARWIDTGESINGTRLSAEGVHYEALPLDEEAFQPRLRELKEKAGYIEQDVIALKPDTPGLDVICAKFVDEHTHDEDEVRFVLEGAGVFDIRSCGDRWMEVTVEPGDLIVVPAGRYHRFRLTDAKAIRCVRLFQDKSGWVPHYRLAV